MNQGARDANEESARRALGNVQDQILAELKQMNSLLVRIANNTAKDGVFIAMTGTTDYIMPPRS